MCRALRDGCERVKNGDHERDPPFRLLFLHHGWKMIGKLDQGGQQDAENSVFKTDYDKTFIGQEGCLKE